MSTEIVPFVFDGHNVRTVTIEGEPWIVVADACAILELGNSRQVVNQLEPDEVSKTYVIDAKGRRQKAHITNEPGLYRLIFRSNKPQAKRFQRWIYNEVLPSIRRTGQFASKIPDQTRSPARAEGHLC
jgi:anti-repressor protein